MSPEDLVKLFDLKTLSKSKTSILQDSGHHWSGCILELVWKKYARCKWKTLEKRIVSGGSISMQTMGRNSKIWQVPGWVPIHQYLIALGLLQYAEEVKGQGKKKLFPELSKRQHGNYGRSVSRWFSTYGEMWGFLLVKPSILLDTLLLRN